MTFRCSLFLLATLLVVGCKKNDEAATNSPAPTPMPTATAPVRVPAEPAPLPVVPATPVPKAAEPAPQVVSKVAEAAAAAVPPPAAPTPAPTTGQKALRLLDRVAETLPAKTAMASPAAGAPTGGTASVDSLADLTQDQVTRGLKEALGRGLQQAIGSLGKTGGFLTNPAVKIPMPEKLQSIEKTLRSLQQDRLADEFISTMNQAAEQAVPVAAAVFTGSLKRMSVEDAKKILNGPKDSSTQYFRKTTTAELTQQFLPIVQQATAKTGATAAFKQVMDRARIASPFVNLPTVDLDGYVTDKTLDGLFKMVAEEEKRVRENPVARTTDLLKSVFGAFPK
jgi:hypothetical protein